MRKVSDRLREELLTLRARLVHREEELAQLARELEQTNHGLTALYVELDDRADKLRRANQFKDWFLRTTGHEFRTPVSSILQLTHLLLQHTDGELTEEQEKQVRLIRKAAQDLSQFVDDLLDLTRLQAQRIPVKPTIFRVATLFGELRAACMPLPKSADVSLVFEPADHLSPLHTDGMRVSQILRNLISNALKFTLTGEVKVSGRHDPNAECVVFEVSDTGIGIAPDDQRTIFEEFRQVDTSLHRRAKGTGLGLPLSRRLARLLGGDLTVESAPGVGSRFFATIPITYRSAEPEAGEGDD